ncbi:SAG family member [Eimeria maxima]|uniref:SAG family member n=1 Tax=Eimeria maxima TaxID=5804 RepID=U6MGU1_EIMMA|nr:SAG family member [Eimeria maxima]CDJ60865.1 SAG family member [Eimeria maxima]
MGSFFKASALCLVALCGMQSGADAKALTFVVKPVGDDAYTTLNLARNGDLTVNINSLERKSTLEETLKTALNTSATALTGSECSSMQFHSTLDKTTLHTGYSKAAGPDYRQMIQKVLDDGLKVGDLASYPSSWTNVWSDANGANLANLLWSKSNGVGCALAVCAEDAAETDTAFLVCQMDPAPQLNNAPFEKPYYLALKERTTKLKDMKEEELKGTTGGSSIAVPSVLLASLVALIATTAA